MRWVVVAVAALAAVVAVNVALLAYGGDRHDPVGKLSPLATLPSPAPAPAPTTTVQHGEHEEDD